MQNNKKAVIYILLIVAGMGLTYYMASSVIPKTLVTFTKAAPNMKVSINSSYVLGDKILAKADGKDKCRINVFVLDSTGKGIPGRTVELTGAEGVKAIGSQTDNDGKMSFEITSDKPGQFSVSAVVGGVTLPRQVKVTFR